MSNNKIIMNNMFNNYELLDTTKTKSGYNRKTLEQIDSLIEYTTNKHSKVLTFRIDIRNDKDSDKVLSSRCITRCIENTKRNIINRHNSRNTKNDPDIHTVRTEERTSKSSNPHYHLQVFVNGNAIKSGYPFFEELSKQVSNRLKSEKKGLVHYCGSEQGSAGILIERNSPEFEKQKEQAMRMGSYLAKVQSKEYNKKGTRVSSSSLISRKKDR